ncbi:serine hydrolase-like protein 2 isoform X2 [Vombatus ursinus]|uniref:serine hydrolase-like protein 2 isoform X2 n=1 Tax=Vombatus ursinus TaxID=29139 RepID=UPI000FFD9114|nr:serine hydrolase-like protein 2 isoform X2 [Vombatus ursinus]XP_027710129.1 serine hydrolase-like protein 2 isoform X2 [Vombatus ursinus]XP_027710130.1 serine hydrolase-like protein 2 isoform X2 [Vombatus ursinus]
MGLLSELKLSVPWGHIAVKAWGSPQGPPVLCLHGWLANANSFDRLIPLLPQTFYYVAMDFGGHGLSSHHHPGFSYHQQDYVNEVCRVVSALRWKRFSILAHSFGSTIGGMFSCIFPEMVDKLIVLDSLPFLLDFPGPLLHPCSCSSRPCSPPPMAREGKAKEKQRLFTRMRFTQEASNLLVYRRRSIERVLQVEAKQQKPPKVVSPEEMLQSFLKNNVQVDEECGRLLLERGTTKVAEGVVLNRDQRLGLSPHQWCRWKGPVASKGLKVDLFRTLAQWSAPGTLSPRITLNSLARSSWPIFASKSRLESSS